ncbi:MAG: hypothetical protein KF709_02305 [Gemmatimonadaceae bacterium]|nr:hypothetical protein [Gemmatimonadaceae bacterium]
MPRASTNFVTVLLLMVAAACGGRDATVAAVTVDTLANGAVRTMSSAPTAPGSVTLEHLLDIQPPVDDSTELMNPRGLAVADDGSVLVSESGAGHIKVFGPTGGFQRSIGRRGQGPNEYEVAFIAVRGDTLLVQDPEVARLSRVLWRSGSYLNSVRTGCCYWSSFGVDAEGRAWVRSISQAPDTTFRHRQGFFRVGVTRDVIDTVFAYERKDLPEQPYWEIRSGSDLQMMMVIPLQPRAYYEVDPTGTLLTGWSGEYSLRETTDGRDTVAIFGRSYTPVPVASNEKQRIVEDRIARQLANGRQGGPDEATYRKAFDASLIPDQQPAYTNVAVDKMGRRWLQVPTADTSVVQFDVFSRDGRWQDTVRLSRRDWPNEGVWAAWGRDRVAVRLEDEDGRPLIRVFAIRQR